MECVFIYSPEYIRGLLSSFSFRSTISCPDLWTLNIGTTNSVDDAYRGVQKLRMLMIRYLERNMLMIDYEMDIDSWFSSSHEEDKKCVDSQLTASEDN